ncbi:MAG: potassium channel protein [Syntrophomonas sp.]
MSEARAKLFSAIGALLGVTLIGTMGLVYFENWSIFNALWCTLVSLTTTGYGDLVPKTMGGRIFLLAILISGVGVVAYSLGAVTSMLVENQISRIMERNKMQKAIKQLNNHIIVCGAGRVGSNVAHVLKAEGVPHVLVDNDPERIVDMEEKGCLVMLGDATQDDVLLDLGINRARGIVCALAEDAFNLFITLTARDINPNIKIVARAERPESVQKLRRAGADKVIAPTQVGGFQLATAILKPTTVDMVENLFTGSNLQFQLEEIVITPTSPLANQQVKHALANRPIQVTIIAVIRNNDVIMNVRGSDIILPGDTLILVGSKAALEEIEIYASQ